MLLLGLGVGVPVARGQATASIKIGGAVLPIKQLTLQPQPGYNALELTLGSRRAVVAVVKEKSNAPGGYTVTLTSANARATNGRTPLLQGLGNSTNSIRYTIAYGRAGGERRVNLGAGAAAVVTRSSVKSPLTGVNKNLLVTIPAGTYSPDTYADTLTLTLANN